MMRNQGSGTGDTSKTTFDHLLTARARGIKSSPVRDLLAHSKQPDVISLAGGIPAPDLFDMPGIDGVLTTLLKTEHRDVLQYGLTEGEVDLRHALSEHARQSGLAVPWDAIIVTAGSQQGLDLISRVLLDRGDRVIVARPTYLAALQVFQFAHAQLESVGVHADGLDLDELAAKLQRGGVKAIYVIPNFANPSGGTLSLANRVALVELARRSRVLILEDDPYGQLRLQGEALPSLAAIAAQQPGGNQHVVHLSSFSKIFAPGVRVGWLALPAFLVPAVAVAKQALDLHTSTLSQRIVTDYLATGRLGPRLEVLRKAYRERRDALMAALRDDLGDALSFNEPEGGLFLWGRLADGVSAERLLQHAIEKRVVFVPGSAFFADQPEQDTLRLSFSMVTEASAREGARRLRRALDSLQLGA
ncbi:MAG: PLP-dependent aminotransferase family protein [Polyangiales bacterium]